MARQKKMPIPGGDLQAGFDHLINEEQEGDEYKLDLPGKTGLNGTTPFTKLMFVLFTDPAGAAQYRTLEL